MDLNSRLSGGEILGIKLGVALGTSLGCLFNEGTDEGIRR
jgi:hypothetical protein